MQSYRMIEHPRESGVPASGSLLVGVEMRELLSFPNDKIPPMPLGLERRHNTGQLHFITVSCYRRQPYLSAPEPKNILEKVIETGRPP